jgi:hypothetical protein
MVPLVMTNSYKEAASLHLGKCNPTTTLAIRGSDDGKHERHGHDAPDARVVQYVSTEAMWHAGGCGG